MAETHEAIITYTIAVIRPNDYKTLEQINKCPCAIKNSLESLAQLVEVNNDTFMETIINNINHTPTAMANTSIIYQDMYEIYQLCYVETNQETDYNLVNWLCTYLYKGNEQLYGNCVIFRIVIGDNDECSNQNITLNNIASLVYAYLLNYGVVVQTDGICRNMSFIDNPVTELSNMGLGNNWKYADINIESFALRIFVSDDNTNGNYLGALLSENKYPFGNIFVTSVNESEKYDVFNKNLLFMIIYILLNKNSDGDNSKKVGINRVNNKTLINNKYTLLYETYNKLIINL
jgi:hypothetical protein